MSVIQALKEEANNIIKTVNENLAPVIYNDRL